WMILECFKAETGILFDSERPTLIGLDPATLYPSVIPRPPAVSVGSSVIPTGQTSLAITKDNFPISMSSPLKASIEEPPIGTEEEEELRDALSLIYDQHNISKS
ncbi:hypothetical protein EDD18DRAFT_1079137, partial [Armillaria luteobubalina]